VTGNPLRIAVVRDFRAEGWPSMDLCADQLLAHLPASVVAEDVVPEFRRVFARLPFLRRAGFNADRLLNRQVLLPRVVRRAVRRTDFVHVVDHSYAHLATAVPAGRAGVYCHDLDAFRCLLEPAREPRPWWFRRLARRTFDGLKRAAVVFHNSMDTRRQLLDAGLVHPDRLVHAPLGVAPEFTPDAEPVELPFAVDMPFLLHVGSNIPRKRLDVLLAVLAEFRRLGNHLRLVQVGGPWPPELVGQIARLGIGEFVTQVRGLSRAQLAELYRRASAVLVTSEAEGFGLPVVEALACGTPVVASDIPTLREAGGGAAEYCPVGDVPAWLRGLESARADPGRERRLAQAAKFSWHEHARIIAEAYLTLASGRVYPGRLESDDERRRPG
jgi:glycosyltransferase involved in cell wall biosynthesis